MAKVAIISFYSNVVSRGVETFVFEIAKRLCSEHQITIIQGIPNEETTKFMPIFENSHLKDFGSFSSKIRIINIETPISKPHSAKGIRAKIYLDWQSLKILIFTLKSAPYLFKGKFNVIIPLNGGWQTVICRILSKITRAKMILSGHAGIGSDDLFNIFFRPDVFVALTSQEEVWARKLAPEMAIRTIGNGVDLKNFNPEVKTNKLVLKKPIIICASALVPYKRVDLTIKAVAKTPFSLLILGDGEMRGQIDSLGKRLLGQRYLRVIVPHDQMPAYLKTGSVFTLASSTEAFGISYVEAMACNLPVVTTSDDSRAEIIGDAGVLTDPENVNQYAKDLTIAVNTNYGNIPFTQASKFSWDKIVQKYSNLINEILRKRK